MGITSSVFLKVPSRRAREQISKYLTLAFTQAKTFFDSFYLFSELSLCTHLVDRYKQRLKNYIRTNSL